MGQFEHPRYRPGGRLIAWSGEEVVIDTVYPCSDVAGATAYLVTRGVLDREKKFCANDLHFKAVPEAAKEARS